MAAFLEVRDVVKRFPVRAAPGLVAGLMAAWRGDGGGKGMLHAVDGVSFSIEKGETVGLVGESGCGKSTLVRLIARLADPTAGGIVLDNVDIGRLPASSFATRPERAKVQMVFQDPTDSLNPRFTAFDTIADPLRRLGESLGRADVRARVRDAATTVGLPDELLGRFPHQLSGGQRARVGIARAVIVRPMLLLLDEPTSSLDVSVQALVLQLLDRLRRQLGMTYLFVSHDLNVVRLLCHRVLVMYLGKIVESGPANEVFARPRHPYAQALVSSIPAIDPKRRAGRIRVVGEPQSPIDPSPDVCRFAGRCPRATDRCRAEMPELRPMGPGRWVACHHADEA